MKAPSSRYFGDVTLNLHRLPSSPRGRWREGAGKRKPRREWRTGGQLKFFPSLNPCAINVGLLATKSRHVHPRMVASRNRVA